MNDEETAMLSARPLESRVRQHRAYLETIQPYLRLKARVYAITLPTITMFPDGRIEHEYNFTVEQKEALRFVDDEIIALQKSFGLMPNVEISGGAQKQDESATF